MADAPACRHCRAWLPCPEDAWCAHCGEPVARLRLSLEPDVLQVRQIAPPVRVLLANESCAELPVEAVRVPGWAKLASWPARIGPGKTAAVAARLETLRLAEPQRVLFAVETPAGEARAELLLLDEHPALLAEPPELELWASSPRVHEVALRPREGALRVAEVRRATPGGSVVLLPLSQPVTVTAAEPLRMRLTLDDRKLRDTSEFPLEVVYSSPLGPRLVPLALRLVPREPPRLRFLGENQAPPELFRSPGQHLELPVGNGVLDARRPASRSARLRVEAATLECPGIPGAAHLLTPLPATLSGDETLPLRFALDLQTLLLPAIAGHEAPLVPLRLRVAADADVLECTVPVRVRSLPVFDGLLAIDFGTSNSCAAVLETGRETEILPLDGRETTSPTLLRYSTLTGALPAVRTGAAIERLAGADDRSAAATLRALKQRLGEPARELPVRPYEEQDWTTRGITEAAGDYLREIRRVAEASRKAVFRNFLLTHPAVCPLRQYRSLRDALAEAFGGGEDTQVRFLQEPVAALVPFFAAQAARLPAPAAYTVASFDLGGGTTDLAIVRVEHRSAGPGRMEMHPAILYSRGVRFGGEDLTDFIVGRLRLLATELLERSRPGAALIEETTPGTAREDALRNRFALRAAAEHFKRGLSEQRGADAAAEDSPDMLRLRVLPPGAQAAEPWNLPLRELVLSGPDGLKTAFTAELVQRVGALAELLAEAEARTAPLDVIQLSGKTSYLPAVLEVLRSRFPRAQVLRAPEPKECVVRGACLSVTLAGRAAQRLVLPEAGARTTSAIGLYDAHSATFLPVLPVDTAIPAAGLAGEVPHGWFGSEPVALFENLSVAEAELRTPGTGSRLLNKLGTWAPERPCPEAQADGWTLQLLLRDLEVEVSALGPAAERVRFHEVGEGGMA